MRYVFCRQNLQRGFAGLILNVCCYDSIDDGVFYAAYDGVSRKGPIADF